MPDLDETHIDWFYELLRPPASSCPESRLWLAVVEEAFRCAVHLPAEHRFKSNLHTRKARDEAVWWILYDPNFLTVCELAKLDGDLLRRASYRKIRVTSQTRNTFLGFAGSNGRSRGGQRLALGERRQRRSRTVENP